jgi:rhodanese-related sulfurtransferase
LSHNSARRAVELGYKNVKVFAAGFPAWKKYAGTSASSMVEVKSGSEEGSIDIATFKDIVKNKPESIMLIDVRDPDEFKKGSFKTAVNIPVDKMEGEIKNLPADKPIVFICSTGARSGESFYMLQDIRPELKKVYYLEAEITFNKDGSYTLKTPE